MLALHEVIILNCNFITKAVVVVLFLEYNFSVHAAACKCQYVMLDSNSDIKLSMHTSLDHMLKL